MGISKKEYDRQYHWAHRDQKLARMRRRYENNKEEEKARALQYRLENSERIKETKRKYYLANKDKRRAYYLRTYYGMTLEQYDGMLAAQEGKCKICLKQPKENQYLCVDHDHKCCPGSKSCGKCVRGLLCQQCNRILLGSILQEADRGQEHAIGILKRAIEYITEYYT